MAGFSKIESQSISPAMAKKIVKKANKAANGEYKELMDFLSGKFDQINIRFDQIDNRFEEVNRKLDQKADRAEVQTMFNQVNDRITRLTDKIDGYHVGQAGMQKQLDKHEKWHFKTAQKVGLDLLAKD